MKKSRWPLLCIPWFILTCCALEEATISVSVESVSLEWDHTIWTDISFTVKNDSSVSLSGVDIHFTKYCGEGIYSDIATFPNPAFGTGTAVAAGSTCIAGVEHSSTTGGCMKIEVTQIVVSYRLNHTETLTPAEVVFEKPQ